ncbi:MAG: magnesium/cobalt efflux protein [Proteobacteria bacterium]|nr:MAG: magnesium/cobalt efflux protein [Pseudomonadota bacterium]
MKNSNASGELPRPRWKQWLIDYLDLSSQNHSELLNDLQRANDKNILQGDAVDMIQGVMQFSVLQVRDIMIPRSQINFVMHDDDFKTILQRIAETEHSRYPVFDEDRDDLVGILLAKDLLRYMGQEDKFVIDDIVRPALLVPESQLLNRLLTEFRNNRAHMAIVIDEYGGVDGLVTFEDVLEQIVGDIDDEHDDEEEDNYIRAQGDNRYIVEATTPLEDFNEALRKQFSDDEFDTVAGLVIHKMGKIPRPGEELRLDGLLFRVLKGDGRRVLQLEVCTDTGVETYPRQAVGA